MHLGIFLALVAAGFAHECSVGNLVLENGVIVSKSIAHKECDGLCKRETIPIWSAEQKIVLLSCEDNHVAKIINAGSACNAGDTEDCYCDGNRCNEVTGIMEELAPSHIEDFPSNIVCYVGYYASDQFTIGDLVQCGQNSVCMKVNGTSSGYSVEVYACMPQTLCTTLFPGIQDNQEMCNGINGTTITGCCCTKQDCKDLMNPSIPPPPTQNWNGPAIQCYSGIALNGVFLNGSSFGPCQGDCASARIRTTYNGGTLWGEVFSCDPANIFSAIGVNGQCQSFSVANVSGVPTTVVSGCMCSSDKCIDPTAVPPVYPIRQLKCYTGLSNGTNSVGAEMPCNERCGRIKFKMNNTNMTYYMCAPYTVCAGFGMAATEGLTYNPPQDEEIEAYCCSATDNCNVDDSNIKVNSTYIPTVVYPTICYGGIWVNGVPITDSAYGLCQGECASASFLTTFAGQTHNATIYTCDPVTMCSTYGIKNGCGQIGNGVTGCCCDYDGCLDPIRGNGNFTQLLCYSGIAVPSDGIYSGGDMICNGMCSSLSTIVNSKNVTTYWCAPFGACRYFGLGLGGNDNCNSITGADPPVIGCCCNTDNCNAPPGVNVTAIPARNEAPIVCYQGLHINGNNYSNYGYQVCHGECVSIMLSGTINSSTTYATLYACDPASACAAMGVRNNCTTIDGTVTACCCDSDACIDPIVGRQPGISLQCYVGLVVPNMNISTGADMTCGGMCARISTQINGNPAMSFHCVPTSICQSLGLYNSGGVLYLDRSIEGYCCNNGPFCNTAGTNINTTGLQPVGAERPKACYSGVYINGSAASDGGWFACQGDCIAVNLNTTLSGQTISAAVYSCDPTIVCRSLGVLNRCQNIEPGLQTCCCDTDACIDPTVTPPKLPDFFSDFCWVGVYDKDHNISAGAETFCYDGQCASLTSNIAGSTVNIFACVPNYVCSYLGLYDDCLSVYYDRSFTACCCKTGYLCNIAGYGIPTPPRPFPIRDFPITCPSGLYVDGAPVTPEAFMACDGDCASMTINATANGIAHSAMLFTCDPSRVCRQLNVSNTCASPEPGLTACCCDTDGCLDPMRGKFVPTNPLTCYVGVYSNATKIGAEVYCDGKCAAMQGIVGNDNVTVFACIATSVCRAQELYDDCKPIYGDRGARACCCDNAQNCNLNFRGMPTPPPFSQNVSKIRDYPIVCYNGIYLNGTEYIGGGGWQACEGDCTSIDLTFAYNNQPLTASLYTCDPVRVCRDLNLVNNCTMIEPGLSGCCCDSNACINPYTGRGPGNPLLCFVGFYAAYNNYTVGATIQCDGMCASMATQYKGQLVKSYHCTPEPLCKALDLDNNCGTVAGDNGVTACCCDRSNNCHVNETAVNTNNIVPANQGTPITCYSGIHLNGSAVVSPTVGACYGQCASVTYTTALNNQSNTLVVYSCDPTAVCDSLGLKNNCGTLDQTGFMGCCCNTNMCVSPGVTPTPGGSTSQLSLIASLLIPFLISVYQLVSQ